MRTRFYNYQSPAGEDDGAGKMDPPATMEVELLSGAKVTLPREQALKEIEKRQAVKGELNTMREEMGRIKAEQEAKAAEIRKAAETAEAQAAVKAGEFEKAKELLQKQADEKVGKLEKKLRVRTLEAQLRANEAIIPEAIPDICEQLMNGCVYNFETDTLHVIGAGGNPRVGSDGKPLSVAALVDEFTNARPYLRKATSASGSGGTGANGGNNTKKSITVAEYEAAMRNPAQAQALAKQLASGELTVKD